MNLEERREKKAMKEKLKRLVQSSQGKIPGPYILEIHPTFRCNLKCIFCAQHVERQKEEIDHSKELTSERWFEIIEEAKKAGVKEVRLAGGGEPLFHTKDAAKIMKKIKERGMSGYITTNGTLFTEKLIEDLVKLGWDKIEMSMDSPIPEVQNYLRNSKQSFDRIISALNLFKKYKQKYKSEKPLININYVVTRKNYKDIEKMVDLVGPLGCGQIILLNLNPGGEAFNELKLNDKQKKELAGTFKKIRKRTEKYGMFVCTDMVDYQKCIEEKGKKELVLPSIGKGYFMDFMTAPCYEPWYYMQVTFHGRVSPCCNNFKNEDKATLKNKSLMEMWKTGHIDKVRKLILKKQLRKVCAVCDAVNLHRTNTLRRELIDYFLKEKPKLKKELENIKKASEKIFETR